MQEIVVLFGQPVAGNPTQFMIEKAFAAAGLDWRYLSIEVAPQDLGDAVRGMRAMGFRGGNCTTPHKVAVLEFLDRTSEAASMMGAVNCIVREGDALIGENTDGKGFMQSLGELTDAEDKHIVLLGAGGAARAIGVEVGLAGARRITVVNRGQQRGEELAGLLGEKLGRECEFVPWEGEFVVPQDADVLIQATSLGLNDADQRAPIAVESLRPELIVADVIPNPPDTCLLREARAAGCRTLDGLGMLVNQGVIGFRLWTGIEPDVGVMRDAVEEFLGV